MSRVQYVMDRLKEPGSIRSLVLVLFLIKGSVVDDVMIDNTVDAILVVLGTASFLMKGDAPKAVAPAAPAVKI